MCEMTRVSYRKIRVVVLAMREMHSLSFCSSARSRTREKSSSSLWTWIFGLQASSAAYIWLNVISNLNEDKLATFQRFEGIRAGCHYQLVVKTNFNLREADNFDDIHHVA